jgi:PAS domain S-box-containing protein
MVDSMNSKPDIVKELRRVEKQGEMKELKENDEKTSQIVDKNPIPTLIIDNKHIITHWNKALEEITDLSAEEMVGTKKQWKAFYSNEHPILADLLVANKSESDIVTRHPNKYHKSSLVEGAYEGEDFFPHLGDDGKWLFFTAVPLRNINGLTIGAIESLQDITKWKKITDRIVNSEEKFRSIFENANDAIFLMNEDMFIECNPKTEEMFRCGREDILQRKPYEFSPPHQPDGCDSKEKTLERINAAFAGDPQFFEWQYKKLDGALFDAEVSLNRIEIEGKAMLQAVVRDITERKRTEEVLRNSEEKYRNLVEMGSYAVITVNLEGLITSCNTAALNMIELQKDEYIGRRLSEVGPLQEGDMPKYLEILDSLKMGKTPPPLEFQFKRKNGISGWAEGHIGLLKRNEKIIGSQLIISDTTSKRMALNELKDAHELLFTINRGLERKIQERTSEIEKLVKQKDEFINQLSHDLKTPLTPIMILMPIVSKQLKDVKSRDLMEIINRNVYFIKDLVDKTVDLAMLNSTKIEIVVEDTNLLSEINNIIGNSQVLLDENNINIVNKIDEKIFVKADRLRLGELLNNLITNSVKYTPDSEGEIIIDAKEDGDFVTISVKDTGIGIKQERLIHVFDEFYKGDISRHDLDSSGLGLAICKRIVEKHGGKIWVESPGRKMGTVFYFTLKSGKNNKNPHE